MKKNSKIYFMSILLAFTLFAGAGLVFAAGTDTFQAVSAQLNFYINGQSVDVPEQPVVINGKTYLPVRALSEVLGKRVGYDQDSKTIVIDELLADGVYKAAKPEFDQHGWKAMVELTVLDGVIADVKYDEVNEQGAYKSQDEAYLEQYKQITGLDMATAMQALETSLTAAQNPDLVDAVSGATYSSNAFKELVAEALAAGPVPTE